MVMAPIVFWSGRSRAIGALGISNGRGREDRLAVTKQVGTAGCYRSNETSYKRKARL